MELTTRLAACAISLLLIAGCTSMKSGNLAVSELALPQLAAAQAPHKSIERGAVDVTGVQAEDFKVALMATLESYRLLVADDDGSLRLNVEIEELKPTSLVGPNPEYSASIRYQLTRLTDNTRMLEDTLVSKYMVPAVSHGIKSSVYSQKLEKYLVTGSRTGSQAITVTQYRMGQSSEFSLGVTHEDAAFPAHETTLHSTSADARYFFAREGAYRKNILGFLILLQDLESE